MTVKSITSRHIKHDWKDWLANTKSRYVKTLCGVTTSSKYVGVPTVTAQPTIVAPTGTPKFGWCVRCLAVMVKQMVDDGDVDTTEEVRIQYRKAYRLASEILTHVGMEVPDNPYLRVHTGPQNKNTEVYERWLEAQELCYLCQKPGGTCRSRIEPKVLGGSDDLYNLAIVHEQCNSDKNDTPPWKLKERFPNSELPSYYLNNSI